MQGAASEGKLSGADKDCKQRGARLINRRHNQSDSRQAYQLVPPQSSSAQVNICRTSASEQNHQGRKKLAEEWPVCREVIEMPQQRGDGEAGRRRSPSQPNPGLGQVFFKHAFVVLLRNSPKQKWGGRPRPRPTPWSGPVHVFTKIQKAGRGRPARTRGSTPHSS